MLKPLHRRRGPLHHALMSCSALAMLVGPLQAFASPATEQAQTQARQVQLDLPAQPLDQALTSFADQAGLHLLYTTGDVAGQASPA
jgi:iron complex outermembrane receptor protein